MKKKKKYDVYFWIGFTAVIICVLTAVTFIGALTWGVLMVAGTV